MKLDYFFVGMSLILGLTGCGNGGLYDSHRPQSNENPKTPVSTTINLKSRAQLTPLFHRIHETSGAGAGYKGYVQMPFMNVKKEVKSGYIVISSFSQIPE